MTAVYHVTATCWIPALDTSEKQYIYTFYDKVHTSEREVQNVSRQLRGSGVTGEIITIVVNEL